jgi:hypothetical protein
MQFHKFRISIAVIVLFLSASLNVKAQDDLLNLLGDDVQKKEFVSNAFKATRVINGHSMEHVAGGVLDFRILHRFGLLNSGSYNAYGFDVATMRIGLDYGISDRLTAGFGRSTNKKELDGFLKYRLIWQSRGKGSIPFSVILISGVCRDGLKFTDASPDNHQSSRYAYYYQMILGRKFTNAFSLQLTPTVVHRNLVDSIKDKNDIYSIGVGTRVKLTQRFALTAEYFYTLPNQLPSGHNDPFSIGMDIETGGHVFQLHVTNALGMNERSFLTDQNGSVSKGDMHFGFNISRVFTINTPKKKHKPELPAN